MEFENLLTLIKTVSDSELTEFAYEENGSSIHLKKKKETVVVAGNTSDIPVMGLENMQTAGNTRLKESDIVQQKSDEPEGQIVKISTGRNFLCSTIGGRRTVCFCRRSGEKRPDTCNRRSDEADE